MNLCTMFVFVLVSFNSMCAPVFVLCTCVGVLCVCVCFVCFNGVLSIRVPLCMHLCVHVLCMCVCVYARVCT